MIPVGLSKSSNTNPGQPIWCCCLLWDSPWKIQIFFCIFLKNSPSVRWHLMVSSTNRHWWGGKQHLLCILIGFHLPVMLLKSYKPFLLTQIKISCLKLDVQQALTLSACWEMGISGNRLLIRGGDRTAEWPNHSWRRNTARLAPLETHAM